MKGRSIAAYKNSLAETNWTEVLLCNDVNVQFEMFHTKVLNLLDQHCPLEMKLVPDQSVIKEPWLTKGLLNCLNKRKSLYKTYLSTKTGINKNKYKSYRNALQKIL